MSPDQVISFARGAPSLDIIDVQGLKAAAARAFDVDPAAVTGYGPGAGYQPLREWIGNRHGVPADQVLITNGSLQADAFVFDHLLYPGDEVVVERPTYDRTLLGLRNRGMKIHQVPMDDEGLDVDELRTLLAAGVRPKLAHVIPNYQNPAGVSLSESRRDALLQLAREYEFTVFEDDPYAEIRFRGDRRRSMLALEAQRTGAEEISAVVHASSFTKTVCPGLRVGYLVGNPQLIAELTRHAVNTYVSPNMLAQVSVHQFCVSGDITRSIANVCAVLATRAATLASALRARIPGCTFREPDGGYFLWVDLPGGVDVAALEPAAARLGVTVVKGTDFLLDGGQSSLRLAYSAVATDMIDEGVRRLAAAYAEVRTAG